MCASFWPGQRLLVSTFHLTNVFHLSLPVVSGCSTFHCQFYAATFFIDKVQSIFTNRIIFSTPYIPPSPSFSLSLSLAVSLTLPLAIDKRIVICFPMHLLLFSDCVCPGFPCRWSLSEVAALSYGYIWCYICTTGTTTTTTTTTTAITSILP